MYLKSKEPCKKCIVGPICRTECHEYFKYEENIAIRQQFYSILNPLKEATEHIIDISQEVKGNGR